MDIGCGTGRRAIELALKSPGKFIFTTLNGFYRLFHPGSEGESFDPLTMRSRDLLTFTDDDGQVQQVEASERYYLPSEITWLLKSLGFTKIEIFGAKLGGFFQAGSADCRGF